MSAIAVHQLTHSVIVRCKDGAEIECAPLNLEDGMALIDLWIKLEDPDLGPPDEVTTDPALQTRRDAAQQRVGQALFDMVRRFTGIYPQLRPHISAGDVRALLPGFIWRPTGAEVLLPAEAASPSSGTPIGSATSPDGANSPT